jgi:hypothetical protein
MKRGSSYTPYSASIRCARDDQSSQTLHLHYLSDGSCTMGFAVEKQQFYVPVMILLKALLEVSDREIFERITMNNTSNTFLADRVELMLRQHTKLGLHGKEEHLAYLGLLFALISLFSLFDFSVSFPFSLLSSFVSALFALLIFLIFLSFSIFSSLLSSFCCQVGFSVS